MANTIDHHRHVPRPAYTLHLDPDGFPVPHAVEASATTPPRKRASRPPFLNLNPSSSGASETPPADQKLTIGKGLPSDLAKTSRMDGSQTHSQQLPLSPFSSTRSRRDDRRVVTDSRTLGDSIGVQESSSRSRTVSYQQPLQHRPLPAPPTQNVWTNAQDPTPTHKARLTSSSSSGALGPSQSSSTTRSADRYPDHSSHRYTLAVTTSASGSLHGIPSSSSYASSFVTPRTPARVRGTVDLGENGVPSSSSLSPTTPGLPDPRRLDRAGLIGVGELATPRYGNGEASGNGRMGNLQQESMGRLTAYDRSRGLASSSSYDSSLMLGGRSEGSHLMAGHDRERNSPLSSVGQAKRERQVSGPRMRGGNAKRDEDSPRVADDERTKLRGVPRLPSFGDLGGAFKIPTPTSAGGPSPSSPSSSAISSTQPPQRTPTSHPNIPSTPSAQSILRQFGSTRDFSHLPPSPSSASINKIMMKESGSMSSLAFAAGSDFGTGKKSQERKTPTMTGSPRKSRGGSEHEKERNPSTSLMDEETREVIRRLDGLGKSSSGSLKARTQYGHVQSSDERSKRKNSSGSGSAGLGIQSPANESEQSSAADRAQSSDTAIPKFPKSTNPTAESGSHSPGTSTLQSRGPSSDTLGIPSSGSFGNTSQKGSREDTLIGDGNSRPTTKGTPTEDVPPVPPLPRSFQHAQPHARHHSVSDNAVARSTTMNDLSKTAAYYVPVRDEAGVASSTSLLAVPSSHQSRLPNSASSPALGTEVFSDSELTDILKSPALSVTSADSLAPGNQGPAGRPRMMSKKWSFSSALNLVSSNNKYKPEVISPGLPSAGTSYGTSLDGPLSPPSGYASSFLSNTEAEGLAPPSLSHKSSGTSESINTTRPPPASSSATIVDQDGHMVPPLAKGSGSTARRGTTTSLPFFRRSSSTSIQVPPLTTRHTGTSKVSHEQAVRHDKSAASASGSQQRKTYLGIGIPALLGGSKRNSLTQDTLQPEHYLELDGAGVKVRHERKGSFGWGGRKRGKTPSIATETPANLNANPSSSRMEDASYRYSSSRAPVKRSSFVRESGQGDKYNDNSISSQRSAFGHISSYSNLPTSRSAILPPVLGSPSRGSPSHQNQRYANGSITSSTPTRIPRISNKAMPTTTQKTERGPMSSEVKQLGTERKASNGSYADLIITADQLRTPATTKSRNHDSPQDLPRTEESEQVLARPTPSGTRHVSGSSIASTKRVLPEPPTKTGETSAHDVWPAGRRTTSIAMPSGVPVQHEKGNVLTGSKSFANHLSTTTASGRVSTASVHSSASLSSRPPSSHASGSRSGSPLNGIVGEDEKLGDEEMTAFFRRQRARQAKGEKMSAELEASLNFPEPADPVEAMTPHAFIKKHFDSLSLYERREILDYSTIWFSGSKNAKRAANPDASQNNYGYDDERGDYLVNFGDHLAYRYEILGLLGKGSFGQVLQCRDHRTGECVAIKIIRNKKRFHHQALVEVRILENLVQWDPEDKHNLIKIIEKFSFRSHLCIVTELLSLNLYELVKANNFVGFSTSLIRRFTVQMLSALQVMKNNRIIHCDLKPENILLRHPAKSGIKVIDFGSSCLEDERVYTYIQSRFYRSPEIILGVKYNMAIDMWSLGCILAEMHTGFPIFPGENEQEQLACIMEVLGHPDRQLVEKGERKRVFFDSHGQPRPVTNSKGKRRRPGSKNLSAILKCDDPLFVDFIAKCLIWDPERRLKPSNAMQHPWILAGKKLRTSNSSPLSSGTQTTSRTASHLKEIYSMTGTTPTRKKSSDTLTNGRYASQPSSALPPSSLSKGSSSRNAHQGLLKAKISKPSPLTPKNKTGSTSLHRSADLAPLSSTPASRPRERQPPDGTSIKVRQLTGKNL